ncbi:hypothetical protein IW148_005323 [Coemansia sp. RSA 1199]|nr:hypothetical protein IW148_005323 [Coemansia sp. RSA 1199]
MSIAASVVLRDILSECVSGPARIVHPAIISSSQEGSVDALSTAFPCTPSAKAVRDTSDSDRLSAQARLDRVICTNSACSSSSDWLTQVPRSVVAWVMGSLALLLSLPWFVISWSTQHGLVCRLHYSGMAMTYTCISLFLRASLSLPSGNKLLMYRASLVFNYMAGLQFVAFVMMRMWILYAYTSEPSDRFTSVVYMSRKWTVFKNKGAQRVLSVGCVPFALVVAGVSTMFSVESGPGAHLIEAALLFSMAGIIGLCGLMAIWARYRVNELARPARCVLGGVTMLTLLWCAFMTARMFSPLNSVARTSEALLYVFNYGVLMVCGIMFRVLELNQLVIDGRASV